MREILFRGKRKHNGEWVKGLYITGQNNIGEILYMIKTEYTTFFIEPETIGQYTGLTDKNGEKVFEGDILYDIYNESNCLITFDEGSFCIIDDNVCCSAFSCSMNAFEIIGNIHDNPELLRGEQE